MSPSTEYLDMDKNDDVAHKNRGMYVSHKCIAICVILVVAALAIVGITTKLLTEKGESGTAKPAEPIKPVPALPKNVRLPRSLVPVHYDVELTPRLDGKFTFNGSVAILVRCALETWNVTLHIKDLNVSDVSVSESNAAGDSHVEHDSYDEDKHLQFLIIKLKRPLAVGPTTPSG
uniref:Aminopeptidase N-like N-terminal domain-containing protein n=1 Tax=Rhipicephalus microplus TaxID=6941 RepID=A0A6G5A129_RHIMP